MNIIQQSAIELSKNLKKKELSAVEITKAFLDQSHKTNNSLNSYIFFTDDLALKAAKTVDAKIAKGEKLNLLEGIPISIKDNICIEGIPTTCASKMLIKFKSPYNSTLIEKINYSNLPVLGKTNLDEFAMGSSTETSFFKPTRNPWNTEYVPGGSSGGAAASVAGLQTPLAIGSDTGGSIRQPAAFCGVVGLKPTYGRVSRYGLVAFASSLDQIGPFAKSVEECAQLLDVIAGYDKKDSTSLNISTENFSADLKEPIKDKKLAVPEELFNLLSPEIKSQYKKILDDLANEGAVVEMIKLPSLKQALATYYIIAPAEASSNLSRYDGVRYGYRNKEATNLMDMMELSRSEGFGAEVKRRILIGTYVLSSGYYDAYYKKAQQVRTLIKQDFKQAFAKYDAIITPTTPTPAFKIGEKVDNPLDMYLTDVMTITVNLAGLPAISIPCGLVSGMPIGLQIIGNAMEENKMLNVAYQAETMLGFKGLKV